MSRRRRPVLGWVLAAVLAATTLGCSIYSHPDGPEDLETGGSSGSSGSSGSEGGKSSSGGSNAEGGSMASAGKGGVAAGGDAGDGAGGSEAGGDGSGGSDGGSGGSQGGTGGGASGSGGSDGGSGGNGGSMAGSAGSSGGNGGAGGTSGSAGSGGSGFAGSGGGIVELAHNRPATGSSEQAIHSYAHGNDGDTGTRWCAIVGTFPEHWRTDLGANYELTSFEVRWEKSNSEYTYEVATSLDDVNYTPQVTRSAPGQLQTGSMMPGTIGRFVRITVTAATGNTWASFYEFKIFGR